MLSYNSSLYVLLFMYMNINETYLNITILIFKTVFYLSFTYKFNFGKNNYYIYFIIINKIFNYMEKINTILKVVNTFASNLHQEKYR